MSLFLIALLNYRADVSGLRHRQWIHDLSASQASGQFLLSDRWFDQRSWVTGRISGTDACPKIVAFGSSTVGGLSGAMLQTTGFLNFWVNEPSVEDFEAFTSLLLAKACPVSTVLIGIDHWFFNAAFESPGVAMLALEAAGLRRYDPAFPGRTKLAALRLRADSGWAEFKEYLTLNITSAALAYLHEIWIRGRAEQAPRLVSIPESALCASINGASTTIRAFDGHYVSCAMNEPASVTQVAQNYVLNNTHLVSDWKAVDENRLQHLKRLVRLWRGRGTKVVLLAPPFHPLTYQKLRGEPAIAGRFDELDQELERMTATSGVYYWNGRNPKVVGCGGDEFVDSHHSAPACLKKIAGAVASYL